MQPPLFLSSSSFVRMLCAFVLQMNPLHGAAGDEEWWISTGIKLNIIRFRGMVVVQGIVSLF